MTKHQGYLYVLALAVALIACEGGEVGDQEVTPCDLYCDSAMANCTGANQLYPDRASCEAACSAMPEGSPEDRSGNSVYCRAYHAGSPTIEDPEMHCPHAAAASEAMVCGTACEGYCTQVMANCTGGNASFPSIDACLAACEAFPLGSFDDTSGNSVQCRTYHASFPAAADPDAHCPHASVASHGGVCGSVCDAYCDQAMAHCTDDNALYGSREECMTACGGFDDGGAFNATTGDTAQCRTYHASFPAAGAPDSHCGHAAEEPTDVCVP